MPDLENQTLRFSVAALISLNMLLNQGGAVEPAFLLCCLVLSDVYQGLQVFHESFGLRACGSNGVFGLGCALRVLTLYKRNLRL